MSVYKTKSGLWVADISLGKKLDGKLDRQRTYFKTKHEAVAAEERMRFERDRRHGKSRGGISFSVFVNDYFWPQKKNLRPTTIKGYRRDLKLRLLPAFGARNVEDIDRVAIQRMIDDCATKKIATNAKDTLSSILGLALEMGVIDVNPAGFRNYTYPPATRSDPEANGVWLRSFEEINRFCAWVRETAPNSPEERMSVLGLLFGMRKGEVLGIDGPQIRLDLRYAEVLQSYTEGEGGPELTDPKTPRAFRRIPMCREAYGYIEKWDLGEGPVVHDQSGKRMNPNTARGRLARLVEGAHYENGDPVPKVTQFSMRHSFGTAWAARGVDRSRLRDWMGHVDSTVTDRYIKIAQADTVLEADLMDALMADGA